MVYWIVSPGSGVALSTSLVEVVKIGALATVVVAVLINEGNPLPSVIVAVLVITVPLSSGEATFTT